MRLSLHRWLSSALLFPQHHSISFRGQAFTRLIFSVPAILSLNIWFLDHHVGCAPYLHANCLCPFSLSVGCFSSTLFSLHLVRCCSDMSPQSKTLLSSLCSLHLFSSPVFLVPLSIPHIFTLCDYSPVSSY